MKICPVCTVPFDDSFSFCEFDGATLEKVQLSDAEKTNRRGIALAIRVMAILMVILGALLVFGLGNRKKAPVAVNHSQISTSQEPSAFIDTPPEARDFVETPVDVQSAERQENNETAKRPGVEVFKPETRQSAGSEEPKTQSAPKPKPEVTKIPETVPVQPNPTKTRIGERTPITRGSSSSPARTEEPEQPERAAAPPVNRTPPPTASRPTVASEPAVQTGHSIVSLNLVRIRSYRTDAGVRYEMTFNMRENGNGRMIRWERLSLVSRSSSGVTHAEAVPFAQRLGAAGSMTFTVSKEMRGRSEADWQGQISCTGIGTDVDGKAVRSTFTARVNP